VQEDSVLEEKVRAFLDVNHAAAMVSLRRDGTPHVARVAVGLYEGRLLSSGTQTRLRTRFLRRDPRCTLFVFDTQTPGSPRWLGLETRVTLIEEPEAVVETSLRFFRALQGQPPDSDTITWNGQPRTADEFRRLMIEDQRLLYEFEVERWYGMY
jgi:PPOX class probable F420-dependent enzyme